METALKAEKVVKEAKSAREVVKGMQPIIKENMTF